MTTATQYRATCPICFRDHAVRSLKNARMVQHGYQRPEGWHANVNECSGTAKMNFGTPEGRKVAAENAKMIRGYAADCRAHAADLEANPPATVFVQTGYDYKKKEAIVVSVSAKDHRYAPRLLSMIAEQITRSKHADSSAAEIERLVAEWKPVEPRAIEVETGPTLHAVNEYWSKREGRDVALCVSSIRSAGYKVTTRDATKITCKACLKSLESQKAAAAISEAAKVIVAEMVAKYGDRVLVQFSDEADQAIREIRYQRKEIDKPIRQAACARIERGAK